LGSTGLGTNIPSRTWNLKVYFLIFNFLIQSNLYTTTSLGTQKKWPLFRGGRYSEAQKN
jgi:hypothetical protein